MARFLKTNNSLEQRIFTEAIPEITALQTELNGSYWRPDEIKITQDLQDWKFRMNASNKKLVENTIVEFNVWDIMVMMTYTGGSFVDEIKLKQLSLLYTQIASWEAIHSQSYSMMGMALLGEKRMEEIITLALGNGETELEKSPKYLKKKLEWYKNSMVSRYEGEEGTPEHIYDHARRVVVNCAVEGIFFQPKFASIYWLKRSKLMPGLAYSNELISRDEGFHARVANVYVKLLGSPIPEDVIVAIIVAAAELECEGVMETHPDDLGELSKDNLCDYVKYSCDFIIKMLCPTAKLPYGIDTPFPWMDSTSATRQSNFFERDVSEYSSRNISLTTSLTILEDF
jgi:ribonucleotide reductase beta subunit family protein with ferritin-like domain